MCKTLVVLSLLALAALSGCFPEDTWSSRVPPLENEPEPPEHLLRKQADFRHGAVLSAFV